MRHRGIAVIGRQDGRPGSLHIQYHETRNVYLEAMLSRDLLVWTPGGSQKRERFTDFSITVQFHGYTRWVI
jgi:hypothetical protein